MRFGISIRNEEIKARALELAKKAFAYFENQLQTEFSQEPEKMWVDMEIKGLRTSYFLNAFSDKSLLRRISNILSGQPDLLASE
jgi:hypothetical protein